VAGSVKTRLATCIGSEAAVELHRELMLGTLELAVNARLAPLELYVTPDTSHPFIQSLARRLPISLRCQQGTDLGQRMCGALQDALRDSEFALLIGSDCPVMTADYLDQACRELRAGADLVVGPAEDGGYVLIGARRCCPRLFEAIPWGSSAVLQATRERAQSQQLRYAELAVLWDVDTPADLERWRNLRESSLEPGRAVPVTV
jgi:rSAM/selenodomain-associated transferase 1